MAKKATKRAAKKTTKTTAKTTAKTTRATKTMASRRARGVSIHIGLNAVSPARYEGWGGELNACESDAKDMTALARAAGLTPTTLLTKTGTRQKALSALRAAAKQLKAGDFLFVTYSGHGGQVPDVSGEEKDKLDETWCLFDGQLIDDELYMELTRFGEGVRVLVLSDSCHSGTVTRARPTPMAPGAGRSKMMPPAVAMRTYDKHKKFYDDLQKDVQRESQLAPQLDPDAMLAQVNVSGRLTDIASACKASVILISGCQDNQTSMDGDHNGAFTEQLLKVWNRGKFKGNYTQFHAAIKAAMPNTQSPNLFVLGPGAAFVKQHPFTV
jgi:hypothetical protein